MVNEGSSARVELVGPPADSIAVGVQCDADGTFHGFGEQYDATNQRGEAFQLLVNEQGNGRDGSPPCTHSAKTAKICATGRAWRTATAGRPGGLREAGYA